MDYWNHDPGADAINRVRGAVADVKSVMIENIEKARPHTLPGTEMMIGRPRSLIYRERRVSATTWCLQAALWLSLALEASSAVTAHTLWRIT